MSVGENILEYNESELHVMAITQALSDLTCLHQSKYIDDRRWSDTKQSAYRVDKIAYGESITLFFGGGEWARHLKFMCECANLHPDNVKKLASKLQKTQRYITCEELQKDFHVREEVFNKLLSEGNEFVVAEAAMRVIMSKGFSEEYLNDI